MLRQDVGIRRLLGLLALCAAVGAAAAWLVALGNPGNMGICGACFLRDTAGSLGLAQSGPKYFRPEVAGLILGAFAWKSFRNSYVARTGSHGASKFFFGVLMGIGALVFLGCPFRMLQRLGGGDLNAVVGLGGFLVGVGAGLAMERFGYTAGKTRPAPAPVGWMGPLIAVILMGMSVKNILVAGDNAPPHAMAAWSFGIALVVGAALSLTGFCAVSAGRQVFVGPRRMLLGALCLIAGYGIYAASRGAFQISFDNQPIAHQDWLWNAAAMVLVGLTGVLAGGCPVRQMILAGEGNGDALLVVLGIMLGGAIAHNLNLASSGAGVTHDGRWAVGIGLVISVVYGVAMVTMKPTLKPDA